MGQALNIATVADQIGGGLLPDNAQWTNRFQVKSQTSSASYVIAQRRSDDVWGCSCRGWTHYRHCKHVDLVLSRLAALAVRAKDYEPAARKVLLNARAAHVDLGHTRNVKIARPKARVVDLTNN